MTGWKFHVFAITVICLIITGLYMLIGPQATSTAPQESDPRKGDRQIEIVSATWGEECNAAIEQALADFNSNPIKPATGNQLAYAPVVAVKENNVLTTVAAACNNKFSCRLNADIETLHSDPLPTCFKKLVVGYRCFSYDKLTTQEIPQGESLKIDCRDNTAPAAH